MKRGELAVGLLASAGAVAFVTAAIAILKPYVPVLSLPVLYELAVLPVAVLWGVWLATAVSIASMLAFNFFFLPPVHTLALRDSANWFALVVYLVTGVVVIPPPAALKRMPNDARAARAGDGSPAAEKGKLSSIESNASKGRCRTARVETR